MEVLQEMFFFAFPEQRNSTKGSLQVYLVCASNIPQSLATIAVCSSLYVLSLHSILIKDETIRQLPRSQCGIPKKAKGPDRGGHHTHGCSPLWVHQKESPNILPPSSTFWKPPNGQLRWSVHPQRVPNISNSVEELLCWHNGPSAGGLLRANPQKFCQYSFHLLSLSGIPCLAGITRPSASWHFCLHILAHLFHQRGQTQLAKALEPMPKCTSEMGMALENALAHPEHGPALLNSAEFTRLVLCWAMASPIRHTQNGTFHCLKSTSFGADTASQMILVPANLFWVDPGGLAHYWMYRLDADEEDSPAEIEEIQQEKTLRVFEGIGGVGGNWHKSIADNSAPATVTDSPVEHHFLDCLPFWERIVPVGNAKRSVNSASGANGIRELEKGCGISWSLSWSSNLFGFILSNSNWQQQQSNHNVKFSCFKSCKCWSLSANWAPHLRFAFNCFPNLGWK